jgi:hypothetical protein
MDNNQTYKLSEITTGYTVKDAGKYFQLVELHQEFMHELNHANSFSEYLVQSSVDDELVQFLSDIQEHGVSVAPSKSSIYYCPPKGFVNIFA